MLHRQAFHVPPMAAGTAFTVGAAERTNNQDARLCATFATPDINGRLRAVHATPFALSADHETDFVRSWSPFSIRCIAAFTIASTSPPDDS